MRLCGGRLSITQSLESLERTTSNVFSSHAGSGERRVGKLGMMNVVKPHNRNGFGNGNLVLREHAQNADGHEVV